MARIENDTTRDPIPFVIIAGPRTGGTFLAHGLSNHPDIYCERQEVIHVNSSYRMASAHLTPVNILDIVLGQNGYRSAGCKLQYSQAGYQHVWKHVRQRKARIIHLTRDNKVRQAVSAIINRKARAGEIEIHPQHSWALAKCPAVTIEPAVLMDEIAAIMEPMKKWRERIAESALECLSLTYEQIVGPGTVEAAAIAEPAARRLCEFLRVDWAPMPVALRRINPWPIDRIVTNWPAIVAALAGTDYGIMLKGGAA